MSKTTKKETKPEQGFIQAWGSCLYYDLDAQPEAKFCNDLGVRCFQGYCTTHCDTHHKLSTGERTHAMRSPMDEAAVTPHYKPIPPVLTDTCTDIKLEFA